LTLPMIQALSLVKMKTILPDILHITSNRRHTHLIHDGHLFELMLSTDTNICLFVASSIYQGSERIRAALNNHFGPAVRHSTVKSLQRGEASDGSSSELQSAIKREGNKMRFGFANSSGESSGKSMKVSLQKE